MCLWPMCESITRLCEFNLVFIFFHCMSPTLSCLSDPCMLPCPMLVSQAIASAPDNCMSHKSMKMYHAWARIVGRKLYYLVICLNAEQLSRSRSNIFFDSVTFYTHTGRRYYLLFSCIRITFPHPHPHS